MSTSPLPEVRTSTGAKLLRMPYPVTREMEYKISCSSPGYAPEMFTVTHHFTLTLDEDTTISAVCSCGETTVGLTELRQVFDLIEQHGEPM